MTDSVSHRVPAGLEELKKLRRTVKQRATEVLAYFDRLRIIKGPAAAINGQLEHLRGSALVFQT